jgi:DNA-binding transcriptional MocR family regulator
MQRSEAWRSLNPPARAVWLEIQGRYNDKNNGLIPLSCREASELCNISKDTASRAFKELIDRGFIRLARDASFDSKRLARLWRLTHKIDNRNGHNPTDEWKQYEKPKTQSDDKDSIVRLDGLKDPVWQL